MENIKGQINEEVKTENEDRCCELERRIMQETRLKKQEGSIVMNCKKDEAKTAASTEYERRGSTSIIADEAKAAAAARMPVEEVIAAANAKKKRSKRSGSRRMC